MCEFISGLDPAPSVCVSLSCQYYTVRISTALSQNWKSGGLVPPALFFLGIALAIWGSSDIPDEFQGYFIIYCFWEMPWNSEGDCTEPVQGPVQSCQFNSISSSGPWTQRIFLFMSPSTFIHSLQFSVRRSFTLNLFLVFHCFSFFFNPHLRMFIYFGKGGREGENHHCERETTISCLSLALQPGTKPAT